MVGKLYPLPSPFTIKDPLDEGAKVFAIKLPRPNPPALNLTANKISLFISLLIEKTSVKEGNIPCPLLLITSSRRGNALDARLVVK
ncbi:hypothetical protein D3C80_1708990 [compost metagenome]